MSKDKLDQFLKKEEESPLESDKIYGGNAASTDDVITVQIIRIGITEVIRVGVND